LLPPSDIVMVVQKDDASQEALVSADQEHE
jgi:hypothetical protein